MNGHTELAAEIAAETAIEKKKVAQAFSRAATSYAGEALLQKNVAQTLLDCLPTYKAKYVLDLGCGTGTQLPELQHRYPDANIIGADLSRDMLCQAQKTQCGPAQLIVADIDRLPIAAGSCDLVYSSLAVQWCSNFRHALSEMRRVTKKGGYIALSTMASGSLSELSQAWRLTDSYPHANPYPDAADYYTAFEQSGLDIIRFAHVNETRYFATFKELLMNLKRTGVNHVTGKRRTGLLTPAQLKTIGNAYEAFRTPQGLPLRFQVIYCLARV